MITLIPERPKLKHRICRHRVRRLLRVVGLCSRGNLRQVREAHRPVEQFTVVARCDLASVLDCHAGGHSIRKGNETDMKKMLAEFKGFLQKGDVVTIAVGLIMALYFTKIVDALLDGVILPIVSAIFGEPDYAKIGFNIGDARISIGLVIDAAISFVVVAFILFLILKAHGKLKPAVEVDDGPSEIDLLTEIRDSLRRR